MGKCNALYQDAVQFAEDTRFYFSTTHNGHIVELETDITLIQGAYIPCVVLDGPDKGVEIYRPALPIVALYEQQQEESEQWEC